MKIFIGGALQTVEVTVPSGAPSGFVTAPAKPQAEVNVIGIPGPASKQITVSDTAPASPELNDLWVDTT